MPVSPTVNKKTGLPEFGPQQVGSAISYTRRYSLAAICGITQQDDDGNAAQGTTEAAEYTQDGGTDLPDLLKRIEASSSEAGLLELKATVQEAGDKDIAKAYVKKMRDHKSAK